MTWSRLDPRRHPGWLMAVLVVAWGVVSIGWGERLPRSEGFGWDGTVYRSMTEKLGEPNPAVPLYRGQRCLPSAAVHFTLKGLGLPLDGPHILTAFAVFNLLLFLVALAALLAAARELGVGAGGRWLLFVAVFVNYAHLKQWYYSACATDVWALAFAAVALWGYLGRRPIGLLTAAVLGAFTWPLLLPFGALLFLFPRPDDEAQAEGEAPYRLNLVLAGAAALAVAGGAAYLVWVEGFYGLVTDGVMHPALPLSIAGAAAFVFGGVAVLLNGRSAFDWRRHVTRGTFVRLAVLGAVAVGLSAVNGWLGRLYTAPPVGAMTAGMFAKCVLVACVAKPLLFLVAHAVWYGPAVVAAALLWPTVCREARRVGLGLTLVLAAGLPLALNPESRQSMTLFLPVALLTVAGLERRRWGAGRWAAFVALALVMSKVWLPLNREPWPANDDIPHFPMQLFFMSVGSTMTTLTYLIQAGAVVSASVVVLWLVRRPADQAEGETAVEARAAA